MIGRERRLVRPFSVSGEDEDRDRDKGRNVGVYRVSIAWSSNVIQHNYSTNTVHHARASDFHQVGTALAIVSCNFNMSVLDTPPLHTSILLLPSEIVEVSSPPPPFRGTA